MSEEIPCHACPLRARGEHTPNTADELVFIQDFKKREVSVAAGGSILREKSHSDELYTLRSGWAFRYRTFEDGRRQILNFLLPGDFIGLQAEIAGLSPYGVEALTESRLCVFPRERLWDLYQQFPRLAYDLTWLSSREELIVDENLLSAGRRSAIERVAMLLVHLYKRAINIGEGSKEAGVIFPLNQQHIADALGLSLVHTNKTLRRLQHHGLHEIRSNRLYLHNVDALQNISAYYALPLRRNPII